MAVTTPPYRQPPGDLTLREGQILEWVAAGLSNKGIGDALNVSEQTVKFHVTHIFRKLNVTNRVNAAHWYWENVENA